jgi:hypothetical protein
MYRVGTNSVGITTNGTEKFRVASNGAIGIGGANYGTAGQVLMSNGSAAPSWSGYATRAWIEFNGTTATPTINASAGVSSITDNGTGDYTVNWSPSMPAAAYSAQVTTVPKGTANNINYACGIHASTISSAPTLKTAAAVRIGVGGASNATGFSSNTADINVTANG